MRPHLCRPSSVKEADPAQAVNAPVLRADKEVACWCQCQIALCSRAQQAGPASKDRCSLQAVLRSAQEAQPLNDPGAGCGQASWRGCQSHRSWLLCCSSRQG